MKHLKIFFWLILILTGCEEKADKDFPTDVPDTIVVQATLTDENHHQEVKITKPVAGQSFEPNPVSGAIVTLSNGTQSTNCTESIDESGVYTSDISFAAVLGQTYYLNIVCKGKTYSAETTILPVSPLNPLSYVPVDENDSLYKIGWVAPDYNADAQDMYKITIDWSHITNIPPEEKSKAELYYYTFKTLDVIELFSPDKEEAFFPKGSIIIEKKYSLTDDYANFLRALSAETVWQGSLFDEARGNLPTNISNGGLGYFTACSVVSDTLIVE